MKKLEAVDVLEYHNKLSAEVIKLMTMCDRHLDFIEKLIGKVDRLEARVKFLEDLRTA